MRATKEYRLSFTEEAKKIVEGLTLEQKVDLMSANFYADKLQELLDSLSSDESHYNMTPYPAGGIEGVIPPMEFCDGPRGVVCGKGQTTCFPVSMARGASFDPELEEAIGHVIGKETRAFGGNLFAGVCINLPYNPGWGRSQETYGEESFAIGQMGAALVRGVQDEDVMACVKHFAFNQMENARFKVSVYADKRTEREVFLPHFKDCIDAGAASIMSSYNLYNQVQCGHHKYLLSTVLKGEWDFDGFVMSDFIYGVKDTVEAANGGQDMEMCITQYFGSKLVKAVQDGFVPESKIDEAALRIVRTILAFDRGHKEYDMSVVGCKEHIALAKRAAEESITLIKNKNVLPLDKKKVKKLAVLGKLADYENIGDHGSSCVYPKYVVTPLQGIAAVAPDVQVIFEDGSDLEAAKKAAAAAAYKKAENEYLLRTNLGDIQINILQRAVKEFAILKEDFDFLLWVASNHKLQQITDICTDTETRLMSFLNNTYATYISGKNAAKKAANEKKAARAAAKAQLESANVTAMSDEEFEAAIKKMKAARAAAKKAAANTK